MNRSIFTMPDRLSFSTYNSLSQGCRAESYFHIHCCWTTARAITPLRSLPNSYFRFLFTSMFFGIAVHSLEARLLTKSYEDFRYPQTTIPQQR
jgi:hypothetical protein